jgi:hypothetical protein
LADAELVREVFRSRKRPFKPCLVWPGSADGRSFRMQLSGSPPALSVGDTLGCRNAAFAFTVHVDGCASSTLRDVTVRGGPGFGFFHGSPTPSDAGADDDFNAGSNTFDGLTLTYPARPAGAAVDAVLSASADAFHAASVRGGPTIVNCLLEGHSDDGIALHGSYSVVVDRSDLDSAARWVCCSRWSAGTSRRLVGGAVGGFADRCTCPGRWRCVRDGHGFRRGRGGALRVKGPAGGDCVAALRLPRAHHLNITGSGFLHNSIIIIIIINNNNNNKLAAPAAGGSGGVGGGGGGSGRNTQQR